MLLTNACEYGIRATLYLAIAEPGSRLSVKDIADKLTIPYAFLAKIAQKLTASSLWNSMRGPTGGVSLARSAEDITLFQIVMAIDGNALFTECVLGLPECGNRKPCPIHQGWAHARGHIETLLKTANVAHLAEKIKEGRFRLAEPCFMEELVKI